MRFRRPLASFVILALLIVTKLAFCQVRLEVQTVPGKTLSGNPLNDPTERKIAVFIPSRYDIGAKLPVVYWLPGFGGSSEGFIQRPAEAEAYVQTIADAGAPVLFVVIDGRTRWGCSQYIDSPGQGNYGRYIAREVVAFVEAHYHVSHDRADRIIAGHSSGGFGALRLAYAYPRVFGRCVALSPDSDFEISHLPIAKMIPVAIAPLTKIEALQDDAIAGRPTTVDGRLQYCVALSAVYAAVGRSKPGRFEWLYNANGKFREDVWKRWMANDPLEIVRRDPKAFRRTLSVYLNGGKTDSYKANIGAGKIDALLKARGVRSEFYESPGGHGSYMTDRIERGILWSLKPPAG